MTDDTGTALNLIDQAFIEPIRTVMLIDDLFPTAADAIDGPPPTARPSEWQRAKRLWQGCRSQRWLCDIENKCEWTPADIACIAGSDLIVLDYHLEGAEDLPPRASLDLLRKLATHPHTNLVVVYTSRRDLKVVQRQIIAWLRGPRDWRSLLKTPEGTLQGAFDTLTRDLGPKWALERDHVLAFVRGDGNWQRPLRKGAIGDSIRKIKTEHEAMDESVEPWQPDWMDRLLTALAERELETDEVPLGEDGDDRHRVHAGQSWIECKNVFIALMSKPQEALADEAQVLIDTLRAALVDWQPSALRAAVAFARAEVRRAGLQSEALSLPPPVLEAGWWYSLLGADGHDEQGRRARQLAADLIAGVGDAIAANVGRFIEGHIARPALDHEQAMNGAFALARIETGEQIVFKVGHALNAFLSCERRPPSRFSCGSVFAIVVDPAPEPSYFVCVSPACDMVPREPSPNYHWLTHLHPWRPLIALRLSLLTTKKNRDSALKESTRSRHLFVSDPTTNESLVLGLRPSDRTEQLTHETFFVATAGDSTDDRWSLQRVVRHEVSGEPIMQAVSGRLIAQLRPPFAEHILSLAGQHLSRVGTDYFSVPAAFPSPKPAE